MIRQRGWSRFEWLIVVSAIGIILSMSLVRYLDMAREGRRLAFELLANHFTTGVALTRAVWLLNRTDHEQFFVHIDGQSIYMSRTGWPMATEPIIDGEAEKNEAVYCQQVWVSVLQNPPQTTMDESLWGERRYHVSSPKRNVCRYELVTEPRGRYFFDYDLQTGVVLVTTPVVKKVPNL